MELVEKTDDLKLPESYSFVSSENSGKVKRKIFIIDPILQKIIDSALVNNQEINISSQEMANIKIMARKGEYLPFVNLKAGLGLDTEPRYT